MGGWPMLQLTRYRVQTSWVTDDDKVEEVGWWSIVPPVITWTKQEFLDLDEWISNIK